MRRMVILRMFMRTVLSLISHLSSLIEEDDDYDNEDEYDYTYDDVENNKRMLMMRRMMMI